MPKVNVYNTEKKKVGSIELDDAVFGAEVKEHLFYTVVRYQQLKRMAGTHKAKGRSEVSGGGKKPWRQKGTGRARQGSTRAPHWRGGGVVFGPIPRDHSIELPKKVRRAALRCALSRRVEEKAFTVFDGFELAEVKTRLFQGVLDRFEFGDLLLILPAADVNVAKSARNIPGVTVLPVEGLNVYDVLKHKNVAATQDAVAGIVARLGG